MTPTRLLLPALALSVFALTETGCGACSSKKKAPEASDQAKEGKGKKAEKKKKNEPKSASPDLVPTGVMAAVEVGPRSYLWTDGRNGTLSIETANLSWSPQGFFDAEEGYTRVIAPGGALYWIFSKPKGSAQPMGKLYQSPGPAPEGYAISADPGRANRIEVILRGPDARNVRIGLFPEAPTASTWLQGELPTGTTVAPRLDRTAGWKLGDDGSPKAEPPEGSAPAAMTAPADDRLKTWLSDVGKLRKGEVKPLFSGVLDLDGDEPKEGLLCVGGGSGDYPCMVVDEVDGERRYHGVNLPYDDVSKGAAPQAFTKNGANYVMWLGPVARAPAGSPPQLQVIRWTGGAYQATVVR